MKASELSSKKITIATLKSFIKKSDKLFVEVKQKFSGMTDCVEVIQDSEMISVSKDDAIGHGGVWCVGGGRDYLSFVQKDSMFGIKVSNCCGYGILWTK
jgi:hypothetical protein